MPISVHCPCGKTLKIADKLAGKSIKCPACQTILSVPDVAPTEDPGFEVVDESPSEPVRRMAVAKPVAKQANVKAKVEEEDDDYEDSSPVEKKKRKRSSSRGRDRERKSGGFEHSIMNGSVIGGVFAMLGAIVWFVLGLMANRIFIYPPILFVVGLIGVIRGLFFNNDD